ncbi:hypothetical protein [Sediminibacterium sp. KACHI17]|jgi:hypothetical protein|uniref:hypothetical protein n=1 Tax=Sediminibacterium sp. KACHI17 TaxID=1751071 RepID=UPI0033657EB5
MVAAEITPETAAITALPSRLDISILAWQVSQLIAEKLLSNTNCLKDIRHPQLGHPITWFLDIGF